MDRIPPAPESAPSDRGYEPPRIEIRLEAEALAREILYAGNGSGNQT